MSPTAVRGCAGGGMDTARLVPMCQPDGERARVGAGTTRLKARKGGMEGMQGSWEGLAVPAGHLQPHCSPCPFAGSWLW